LRLPPNEDDMPSPSCGLSADDLELIVPRATKTDYRAGESVFAEGEPADYIYFIQSGKVSIYLQKFTVRDEIQTLGPGDCFGEMAILLDEARNASAEAVDDTTILTLNKQYCLGLIRNEPEIADKLKALLAARNEELILRETLISSSGIKGGNLHVSIKGDPSLRETALFRERYESFVDRVLPRLGPSLEELLLERCVYQIFIGFNSGEVRTTSLLNPFIDEIHQVSKLLERSYVDRHFPPIAYQDKAAIISQLYRETQHGDWFGALSPSLKNVWSAYYDGWEPVAPEDVRKTVASLPTLRSIENFYLRNITLSMVRPSIHMQFNCDGTHIVGPKDYERFLEENL
jgi:CRP-like cAMP-binding protein